MNATEAQTHNPKRINLTLLTKPEQAFIRWFVCRVPDWVTPDILTGIGFTGSLLIFGGYCLTHLNPHFLWLVNFGLLLNWFGDSTDGNLARYRKTERPRYGFFLDHSVDAITQSLIFLGLGISPYVHFSVALLAMVGYLLLSIFVFLNTIVSHTFQISFARLGPTEARVLIMIANVLMFAWGKQTYSMPLGLFPQTIFSLFDFLLLGAALVMVVIYLTMSIKQARYFSRLEPEQVYHSPPREKSRS